ncbi:hypothetical protein F2Q68_00024740 [Brassica cretica]|uniref:Uncharacterized protein n=1 Tax=Brassica cretica TaxID=69181 RepID=A0A8S9IAF7_BRACR|nr:hypothetical protein F2Q68_00024740 [Brassica cretica]
MAAYTRQNMHTEEFDEDYEEERATEYKNILDEQDKLLHHCSWKKNAPTIDRTSSPSIDTQPHQRNQKRASTDIAYYPLIDTYVDATRDRDYSIGSWADDRHHGSYAVDTSYCVQGADELHEGFTYEELLNMQRHDETDQKRAEAVWGRSNFSHSIGRAIPPSIDINPSTSIDISHTTSIDIHGHAKAIDGRTLHVSREDIADILQTANEADNLFMRQHTITEHQQKVAKEFYDTAGGMDKSFKQRSQHPTQPSIDVDVSNLVDRRPEFGSRDFDLFGTRKLYWKEKDEYGIYRDDQGYARDVDGHTIYRKTSGKSFER